MNDETATRTHTGEIWDLGDWCVLFTSPERERADLAAAYQAMHKSITTHVHPPSADVWLARTESYKGITARLVYRVP